MRRGSGNVHAVRNVLANWGAFVLSALVGFVLSPYVVHHLGNTQYGIWVLLGSLVGYLGLLDLGVRGGVTRFVANLHAAGNHDEAGRMASAGLTLFGLLGLLAILVSIALALALVHLFQIPPELLGVARLIVVLGGLNIAAALVSGVFGGIIVSQQRFDINSSVEIALTLVRSAMILLVLHLGYGLLALSLVQLGNSLARGVVDFSISRRLYPELRIDVRSWSREHVHQLLGFSAYATLLQFSGMIILRMDSVVIGAFLPVSMIAFFGIAANLTDYARSLIAGISQTVAPRASALQGRGEAADAGHIAVTAARMAALTLFPIVITFLLRGSAFISIWMGESYGELAGRVLFVLSLLLWTTPARQVIASALLGLNRHRVLVPIFVVEALVNVGLSVLLVKRMGIVGVAWGTTAPGLVASLVLVPRAFCKVQRVPLREVWPQLFLRPLVAMAPFGLALYAIARVWQPTGMLGFFAEILVVLPVAALGAWAVGLKPGERQLLWSQASAARRLVLRGSPSGV